MCGSCRFAATIGDPAAFGGATREVAWPGRSRPTTSRADADAPARLGLSSGMSSAVVALVLASALVHAGWNALLKRQRNAELAVAAAVPASALFAVLIAL